MILTIISRRMLSFIAGAIFAHVATAAPAIAPECATPATYVTKYTCPITISYRYFVTVFGNAFDVTHELEAAYGFTAIAIFDPFGGNQFFAELTPPQVASLRCDARVLVVQESGEDVSLGAIPPTNTGPCATGANVPLFGSTGLAAFAATLIFAAFRLLK